MKAIVCPACGGLVEAAEATVVMELAREHCVVAHGYAIPDEHLAASIEELDG